MPVMMMSDVVLFVMLKRMMAQAELKCETSVAEAMNALEESES